MDIESFRENGHLVIDWIADYLSTVEDRPVTSSASPGQVRSALPKQPPREGEPFSAMLADVDELIMPGITHWQSPSFFAYFPCNHSPPAILGDLLASGLGVQGMLWATSPACTELETHVMDWLADMMELPAPFTSAGTGGGVIQSSASDATLCALIAAREKATAGASNRGGCRQPLTAYASTQAHSSLEKDCRIAGIGSDNLRLIEVDDNFAMQPEALAVRLEEDRRAGAIPFFVMACSGTTSSLALDPIRPIGEICRDQGLWLHVDAAMAGSATICPEHRHIIDGTELADSYVFNPHKWLLTNFDCSAFFVADRSALTGALGVMPEYLKNVATASGEVTDYRDWQLPLGRRFRALKLWFVIRSYGVPGLQAMIRHHVALAQDFKRWVCDSEIFELVVDTPLNLICFCHRDGDAASQRLLEMVNADGRIYLTHTRLNGRYVLRMSIGQRSTEARHVRQAWALLNECAQTL